MTHEKIIRADKGHLLEKLDDDIQSVNALKTKLLYEKEDRTNSWDSLDSLFKTKSEIRLDLSKASNGELRGGGGGSSNGNNESLKVHSLRRGRGADFEVGADDVRTFAKAFDVDTDTPNFNSDNSESDYSEKVTQTEQYAAQTRENREHGVKKGAKHHEILENEANERDLSHALPQKQEWFIKDTISDRVDKSSFRNYIIACNRVKLFYKEQHEKQTFAYNIQARINFKTKVRAQLTVWDALVKLNKLIDESDPDTELSQIDHALQTAEAIRRDGKPRWMQLVGLIHDLGKLLYFFDAQGQWDVVGDTFPVGCAFSNKIIFHEFFKNNPDSQHPIYKTKFGIYSANCGLENVMLSWGHDEYMYQVAKLHSTLPNEALAMIRYHSCYPIHREGAYRYLMNENDVQMIEAVKAFNPYDLYSKIDTKMNVEELEPYYLELIDEFFPNKIVEF